MNRPRTAVVAVILSGIFYTSTLSADLRGDATSQVAFGIKVAQQGL